MDNLTNLFMTNGQIDVFVICTLVFRILMLVCIAWFSISIVGYFKKNKILQAIYSKITGNAREYDRIRRIQMKSELEKKRSSFSKQEKSSLLIKLYILVSQTGIVEKIPGFSEAGFLICISLISIMILIGMGLTKGFIVGLVAAIAFLIIVWYCLSLLAYSRKVRLEQQLLQFTNACASASMQYSNIIDIFGAIYEQFTSPLKEGLEACYVEAKQTNNKELALKHLKEKYDSVQFAFVIDNLELCSTATGDYYTTARDISETVSIYSASHEKKRVLLRNAKINITAMFVIGCFIFYALGMFLGNLSETLFDTTVGNIAIIVLILLYFYGLNLKADK